MADGEIMNDTKIFWVCGMPRSGSMWTFNVVRKILVYANKNVYPKFIPQDGEDAIKEANIGLQNTNKSDKWVLKVHIPLNKDFPSSKFIVNRRDLRDALISFQRFMKCDFNYALKMQGNCGRLIRYYESFPRELCLFIDYKDMLQAPEIVVKRISNFVGVALKEDEVKKIVHEFSKENVVDLISRTHDRVKEMINSNTPVPENEIVGNSTKYWRAIDANTGFQSGHVSDYVEGDWKKILTEMEQQLVNEELKEFL